MNISCRLISFNNCVCYQHNKPLVLIGLRYKSSYLAFYNIISWSFALLNLSHRNNTFRTLRFMRIVFFAAKANSDLSSQTPNVLDQISIRIKPKIPNLFQAFNLKVKRMGSLSLHQLRLCRQKRSVHQNPLKFLLKLSENESER